MSPFSPRQFVARGLWRLAQPLVCPAQRNGAAPPRGAAAFGAVKVAQTGEGEGHWWKNLEKTGKNSGKTGEKLGKTGENLGKNLGKTGKMVAFTIKTLGVSPVKSWIWDDAAEDLSIKNGFKMFHRDSIEHNENTLGNVVVGLRIKKCVISPAKYGI